MRWPISSPARPASSAGSSSRNLLKRGEPIYVLVRKGSLKKLDALREALGRRRQARDRRSSATSRKPNLGVADADLQQAQGQGRPLLPSRRDLRPQGVAPRRSRPPTSTARATRSSSRRRVNAGCFHHVSSIAAAGLYDGVFREDMFEEAEDLDHPYFKTKHDSEAIVRNECKRPFRIYRPGLRRRPFEDRLHRQDRRAVLLLQADPEDARAAAAVDADDRHRGRAHQHRAGRLRRRRARLHRAQEGPRRQVLPPDRSRAAPHRRGAQHLRQGRRTRRR